MKIISIVGARPQFVKLAPLSRKLRDVHQEIIIHTGQHYDDSMSASFFRELNIPEPDYNLAIGSGNHGYQTGHMLIEIETILLKEKPDKVIVFGDTNSTVAGAMASAKLQIPVIHIEAGLRSFNRSMPEELNRIATDHLSDFLFAPTETAMINLEREGLVSKSFLTGDIMVDSLGSSLPFALERSQILEKLNLKKNEFYLVTLHRPYNVDDPSNLQKILEMFSFLDKVVIFPVHPRTNKIIHNNNIKISKNIILSNPLGYLDFIMLESNSYKIITDSGGIQKEAYILKKPCITLRPETEWVETVNDGWNILVDFHEMNSLEKIITFNPLHTQKNVFGMNVSDLMIELINK